jgi:hypothetical protein
MTRHHAYTVVDRYKMRATTATPWRAHCHVCCCRLEVPTELIDLGMDVVLPTSSWYAATRDEAQAIALSHLRIHVEVPA